MENETKGKVKDEVVKIQFRKHFLNACREGKVFAINFGTLKVDLTNYLDEETGLRKEFFDLEDFVKNCTKYTTVKDRHIKGKDLDYFPLKKEGFGVVVISEESD